MANTQAVARNDVASVQHAGKQRANGESDKKMESFDNDVLVSRYPATVVALTWLRDQLEKLRSDPA
jgi:hypothetical protein